MRKRAPAAAALPERVRLGVIYSRISKDEIGDELGVRRHTRLCLELAARMGVSVAPEHVFIDDDTSGFSGHRRPGWDQARQTLATGRFGNLITYDSDRLSREDLRAVEDLIDLLRANDVLLHSVNSGMFDLNTVDGRERARGAAVRARAESERTSKRLRDKMAELVEAGKPNGGPRPYGWRRIGTKPAYRGETDTRQMVPEPAEAAVVNEMTKRVASGETLTRIAQDLNGRGIRTRAGNTWNATNLRQVVMNGANAGLRFHHGQEVGEAEWAKSAIVDRKTWRRAYRVLTHEDRPNLRRRSPRRYLLTGGLLRCGRCGCPLYSKPAWRKGEFKAVYVCSPSTDLHHPGCGRTAVQAIPVEELVAAAVIDYIEAPSFAQVLASHENADDDAAAEAATIEAEMRLDAADAARGVITRGEWKEMRPIYEGRLAEARARLASDTTAAAASQYAGQTGQLRAEWDTMTLDRRQALVRAAVEKITILPVGRGGRNRFNPDRVQITWR